MPPLRSVESVVEQALRPDAGRRLGGCGELPPAHLRWAALSGGLVGGVGLSDGRGGRVGDERREGRGDHEADDESRKVDSYILHYYYLDSFSFGEEPTRARATPPWRTPR